MKKNSSLTKMFGKSPIISIQKHMTVAHSCARLLIDFFTALINKNWDDVENIQQEIVRLENRADKLKKSLRLQLPGSLFLPVPRSDLLDILNMQDKVANRAKDIAGIIVGRKMDIPLSMHKQIIFFVSAAVEVSDQALIAINSLDELLEAGFSGAELGIVERMIDELDRLEHIADKLEIGVRADLFKLEAQLAPVDVIFLYRVIDWIGDLADRSQRVGSRLQLLLAR